MKKTVTLSVLTTMAIFLTVEKSHADKRLSLTCTESQIEASKRDPSFPEKTLLYKFVIEETSDKLNDTGDAWYSLANLVVSAKDAGNESMGGYTVISNLESGVLRQSEVVYSIADYEKGVRVTYFDDENTAVLSIQVEKNQKKIRFSNCIKGGQVP